MQEIEITSIKGEDIIQQLNTYLEGSINEQWGECVLEFDNSFGKGTIRSISFDWGISLMDYDVNLSQDLKIIFKSEDINPIEFIFVSEGNIKYQNVDDEEFKTFERYQNIIISNKKNSKQTYLFPGQVEVKVNFIYLQQKEFSKKKNNNISYLNKALLSTFDQNNGDTVYNHFGNFNLKIADQIRQLQETQDNGIVRTLSIEGQLNLIMAMQILEHDNYESGLLLPDSLSREDIKKIHKLSDYILDNISEPLSVGNLASVSGLSPKKLQMGFKVLYSKSVNEYIRQLKLEISRDYIKNTDYSISEIVYNIGLKSRSYFSKIFQERYGILPTEYRKKIKVKE